MKTIVLASGNAGKLREFNDLLLPLNYIVKPQSDFNIVTPEETGTTFVENAILKARHACTETGLPAIADDSGIEVDALNGQPGIYSARYAGENANDTDNNQKLLSALQDIDIKKRTARYQCILVFMRHKDDPTPIICQESWEGHIIETPTGEGGFGYDPLFFVPNENCTAAQLSKEKKNAISHRGKAMRQLLIKLETSNN